MPRRSKQGKHQKTPKKDRVPIMKHIKLFNPAVFHHRRVHAPKRLYLPSEITIQMMYNNFLSKHPDYKCSYELYRNVVSNDMNISFTVLGNEECENCEEYINHKKAEQNCETCSICVGYQDHKRKYYEARKRYDDQRMLNTLKFGYYALDIMKITMLPRLDMFKKVIFCPRAVFFNESFVPLGGKKKNICQPIASLLHEGISGRDAKDFVSAIYKFLLSKRDLQEITLWLDNCSAQNKNWTLYSFLVYIINTNEISANKIYLNYFEPGHSFIAADSFHHQVELAMGKKKKCMVQVTATRGSFDLVYKTSFDGVDIPINLLKETCKTRGIVIPEAKQNYRGIAEARKLGIITKMKKIIPAHRLEFWKKMPVTGKESALYGSDDECDGSENDEEQESEDNDEFEECSD